MPFADINGCRFYYEITGEGAPLVMIRGLGSNLDHWYPQIPALANHFRILTFDNPGIARTKEVIQPYSIKNLAAHTVELMEAAGFEKANVFGLSMGGMIAQELALNFPEKVSRLILCVTHCGKSHAVPASDEVNQLFNAMVVDGSDEARLAAAAVMFAPETLSQRPEIAAKYGEISMQHPASADILALQGQAIQAFDAWDRLPEIAVPTLALGADKDVLIPPENLKIIAERIPGASLKFIRDGGHQVLVEQADACNQAILSFLNTD